MHDATSDLMCGIFFFCNGTSEPILCKISTQSGSHEPKSINQARRGATSVCMFFCVAVHGCMNAWRASLQSPCMDHLCTHIALPATITNYQMAMLYSTL